MPLDERKLIARRCAFELPLGGVVNLGIGMPEGVAAVAAEERVLELPDADRRARRHRRHAAGRARFRRRGQHRRRCIHQNQQFDFYDGGGLDLAVPRHGRRSTPTATSTSAASARGSPAPAASSTSARTRASVVFAGTFTAGGLEVAVEDGRAAHRCAKAERASSSTRSSRSPSAALRGRSGPAGALRDRALRVPPRAADGMELIEVAPGIDIERDILAQMDFRPIVRDPQPMDPRIFRAGADGARATRCSDLRSPTASATTPSATRCSSTSRVCTSAPATMSTACAACSRRAASDRPQGAAGRELRRLPARSRPSTTRTSRRSPTCRRSYYRRRRATRRAPSCG